ncbi:hypothetical protein D3C71_1713340 [compost metagenome]
MAHRLQLLEDGRQRVRLQEELFAEAADGLAVRLRQRHQGDVLGIGEPELVQHGTVELAEGEIGRVDREAQEVRQRGIRGACLINGFHLLPRRDGPMAKNTSYATQS